MTACEINEPCPQTIFVQHVPMSYWRWAIYLWVENPGMISLPPTKQLFVPVEWITQSLRQLQMSAMTESVNARSLSAASAHMQHTRYQSGIMKLDRHPQ